MNYERAIDMPDAIQDLRRFAFSPHFHRVEPKLAAAIHAYVAEYDELIEANRQISNASKNLKSRARYHRRRADKLKTKLAARPERIQIKRVEFEVTPQSAVREIRALHRAIEDHREVTAKQDESRPIDVALYRAIQTTTAKERAYWSATNDIRPEQRTDAQEAA